MVTDRIILVSNGDTTVELTAKPYSVQNTKGFDQLNVQIVSSQGFDQLGASLLNSYVLPRDMEITGQVYAETTKQMQDFRDRLFYIFIPNQDVTVTHYYGYKNRQIKARVQKTPKFDFTNVTSVQNYSISLKAMEPYWRDTEETLIQMANIRGGFHFPLVIPKKGVTFGIKSASLIANVYNAASVKTGMRFTFKAKGSVSNPQLFNVETREYFRLLCDMIAGEKITVSTGQEKEVKRNMNGVEENYMGKIDLAGGGHTFLELSPGDNLFRYGADSGESMLEISISFYNQYIGV